MYGLYIIYCTMYNYYEFSSNSICVIVGLFMPIYPYQHTVLCMGARDAWLSAPQLMSYNVTDLFAHIHDPISSSSIRLPLAYDHYPIADNLLVSLLL